MDKKRNDGNFCASRQSKKSAPKKDLSGSSDDSDKDGEVVVSNTVELPTYKSDVECGICTIKYDARVPSQDILNPKSTLLATKVDHRKLGKTKSLKLDNEDILNNLLLFHDNKSVCNVKCKKQSPKEDSDDEHSCETMKKTVSWNKSQNDCPNSPRRQYASTKDKPSKTCIKQSTSETIKICKSCDRVFIGADSLCSPCFEMKQKTIENCTSKRERKNDKCKYCGVDIGSLQENSVCYQCQLNLMTTYSPNVDESKTANIKICLLCNDVYESKSTSKICKACKTNLKNSEQKQKHDKCSCSSNDSISYSDFKNPLLSSTPITHDSEPDDPEKCAFCSQSFCSDNYKKVCLDCLNEYKMKNEGKTKSKSCVQDKPDDQIEDSSPKQDNANVYQVYCCTSSEKRVDDRAKNYPEYDETETDSDSESRVGNKQITSDRKHPTTRGCAKKHNCKPNNNDPRRVGLEGSKIPKNFERSLCNSNRSTIKSDLCTGKTTKYDCAWCGKPLQKDTEVMCLDCKQFFANTRNTTRGNLSKHSLCDSRVRVSFSKTVTDTDSNTSGLCLNSRSEHFNDCDGPHNDPIKRLTDSQPHKTCLKKVDKDDKSFCKS